MPTFWDRRSQRAKIDFVLCFFTAVVILALFSTVFNLSFQTHHSLHVKNLRPAKLLRGIRSVENDSKCETAGCIEAAANVRNYLNESVDPCENFYEFACGNFVKNTILPEGTGRANAFTIVNEIILEQLRTILNESQQPNEPRPFQLAKNFYSACLNETIIKERDAKPLVEILEELGGWPMAKGDLWSDENFDWIETIMKFRRLGISTNYIFNLFVDADLRNSSRNLLFIDQPSHDINREFLIKGRRNTYAKAYILAIALSAHAFGAYTARVLDDASDVFEFEVKLANISLSKGKRRNFTTQYNPWTIKQLQEEYPYLNWSDYINALLPTGLEVTENETVINVVPTFFKQLGDILKSTSKRTLANYLLWRAVHTTSTALPSKYRIYRVESSDEPRWRECAETTSTKFPISVGALYTRRFFNEKSRQAAIDLVDDIRGEFLNILHNNTWMDENTRAEAIKKAKSLTAHIGYPSEFADNNKLEEYYKDLELEKDDYFLNNRRVEIFNTDNSFNNLRKPINKTEWKRHSKSTAVNAYYNLEENSINFSAAILQNPFFSPDRPQYMNYASVGAITGHEITHGFDDKGRQFDFDGNLVDWWEAETKKQFLENVQCIIEQYGNYTDHKLNISINGINTQGENIADNGGVKVAYYAYIKYIERNSPESTLPELKYNQKQLFWISFAQTWCECDLYHIFHFNIQSLKTSTGSGPDAPWYTIGTTTLKRMHSIYMNRAYKYAFRTIWMKFHKI